MWNTIKVSLSGATVSTVMGFLLAYIVIRKVVP